MWSAPPAHLRGEQRGLELPDRRAVVGACSELARRLCQASHLRLPVLDEASRRSSLWEGRSHVKHDYVTSRSPPLAHLVSRDVRHSARLGHLERQRADLRGQGGGRGADVNVASWWG